MSNDSAFLSAILDHPDEDGPRLVYADWLDERGDPRGEFIRIQCELAKWPCPCRGPDGTWYQDDHQCRCGVDIHRRRERELWGRNGPAWAAPLADVFGLTKPCGDFGFEGGNLRHGEMVRWVWRRGFVEVLQLEMRTFTKNAKKIFNLVPISIVGIADRHPSRFTPVVPIDRWEPDGIRWWWPEGNQQPRRFEFLPRPIYNAMKPTATWVRENRESHMLGYRTRDDAIASLSAGCVAWGRSLMTHKNSFRTV